MEKKIKQIFKQFCKETGRGGGILVHSSIGEWHTYLAKNLKMDKEREVSTAEIFLIKQGCQRAEVGEDFFDDVQPKDLIEFAKMHVKAARAAYHETAKSKWAAGETGYMKEEDFLLAYPEENIK